MKVLINAGLTCLMTAIVIVVFFAGRYTEARSIQKSCLSQESETWINGESFFCVDYDALRQAEQQQRARQHGGDKNV